MAAARRPALPDATAPAVGAAARESRGSAPWRMEVAERRAGAPTSPPAAIQLAALQDAHLVAVGAGGGVVALYLLQVGVFEVPMRSRRLTCLRRHSCIIAACHCRKAFAVWFT